MHVYLHGEPAITPFAYTSVARRHSLLRAGPTRGSLLLKLTALRLSIPRAVYKVQQPRSFRLEAGTYVTPRGIEPRFGP